MRSACGWAAWCFHSLGQACGRSGVRSQSGVPSAVAGSTVQAVKSVPMPITSSAGTPAAATAAGTAWRSTSIQSCGDWSAQSGPSRTPEPGSSRSITPCAYSWTALPSSAPSDTRTTTARPDSVPKSTPTTYLLAFTLNSRGFVRGLSPAYITAHVSRHPRSGCRAGPDDEAGRHDEALARARPRVDLPEQHLDAVPAHLVEILPDRGERRREERRLGDVVETHDADLVGYLHSFLGERAQHAQRHLVVGREDGGDAVHRGQDPARLVAGVRAPVPGQRLGHRTARLLQGRA